MQLQSLELKTLMYDNDLLWNQIVIFAFSLFNNFLKIIIKKNKHFKNKSPSI